MNWQLYGVEVNLKRLQEQTDTLIVLSLFHLN